MKVIIISDAHEKLTEFFIKQGSFEVPYSLETLTSNLEMLKSNIIRVDKMLVVLSDTTNFSTEVRSLLSLLDSPSGLVNIGEIVFFYKNTGDVARIKELIRLISDSVATKSNSDPRWKAPKISKHELEILRFNDVYRSLMGVSSSEVVDATTKVKYRVERGDDSFKAFEPTKEAVVAVPFSTCDIDAYESLKSILKKTESTATLTDYEVAIPVYENLKLREFSNNMTKGPKWILTSGTPMSGNTLHTTVLATSAKNKGCKVLALDLSENGGLTQRLNAYGVKHSVLSGKEIIDQQFIFSNLQGEENLFVYEGSNAVVRNTLPLYIQKYQNIYTFDYIFISVGDCDLALMADMMSGVKSLLIFSSPVLVEAVDRLLSRDFKQSSVVVWFNDHITLSDQVRTYDIQHIKKLATDKDKNMKIIASIYFEDLDVDGSFITSVEGVI